MSSGGCRVTVGYKKALLSAIIICLTLFPVSGQSLAVQQPLQGLISIEQVLGFVGCDVEYLNVTGWCVLNKGYMPFDDLKSLAQKAVDFFSVIGYDLYYSQDDGIRQVSMRGTNKAGQVFSITCRSIQISAENGKEYENYMVVDILDGTHKANSRAVKDMIRKFFNAMGVNATITATMVGSFEGKLEAGGMQSICSGILRYLGAKEIEGLYQEGMVSISGYSPALGEGIISGGRPVNVQVALRYNSNKGRTYMWVGTPMIGIEY